MSSIMQSCICGILFLLHVSVAVSDSRLPLKYVLNEITSGKSNREGTEIVVQLISGGM